MTVRAATPADVPGLVELVHELAAYERAAERVELDADALHAALFGPSPALYALVAVDGGGAAGAGGDGPPAVVGCAVWFVSFSTWLGRHGAYLEDLYVRPSARRRGHGRALLAALARLCTERGYGRLEWSVLDWNTAALDFYRSLGAAPMTGWTVHRLSGPALRHLGGTVAGVPAAAPLR